MPASFKGKKRHVLVDTQGLLNHHRPTFRIATAGDVSLSRAGAYHRALAGILPDLETEIVKRSDRVKGFVVQPRRWVVERTEPT